MNWTRIWTAVTACVIFSLMGMYFHFHSFIHRPESKPLGDQTESCMAKLTQQAGVASKVVVFNSLRSEQVYESSQKADIEALISSFNLTFKGSITNCSCAGGPYIVLYSPAGERVLSLNVHHSRFINFDQWIYTGTINDPELLHQWLDARGITWPRKSHEESQAIQQAN